ncbi:MAG: serine/threonine-protein phosphatase [Burkholderiales bacterium]|nr:serine/threonine-protein phosphatase [Burkholderiales bacterium]
MQCESCGFAAGPDDVFCESCGGRLAEGASRPDTELNRCPCGDTQRDASGYCLGCGRKSAVPTDVTFAEIDANLAWASDRGRVHLENQDAAGILRLADGTQLLVVSDGVSSADRAAEASQLAVQTVLDRAVSGIATPPAWIEATIDAAHQALQAMTRENPAKDDPQATIVVAVVRAGEVWFGWLGDSRIYLLHAEGNRQLTLDDSWANEAIAAGLPREEAQQEAYAHCITQCLGMREAAPDIHLGHCSLPAGAILLLCSDGLWNYLPTPDNLAAAMQSGGADEAALVRSRHLVDLANTAGGVDNISVALLQG